MPAFQRPRPFVDPCPSHAHASSRSQVPASLCGLSRTLPQICLSLPFVLREPPPCPRPCISPA